MKIKQISATFISSAVFGFVFLSAVMFQSNIAYAEVWCYPEPSGDPFQAESCPDGTNEGSPPPPSDASCEADKSIFGIPTWYKYLESEVDRTGKCSPKLFDSGSNDEESAANNALPIGLAVLEGLVRIAGLVAVGMVFLGAFKYITSRGNPESASGARSTIINALIGLAIVIVSTAVINFIGNSLVK